jgi:NNP family nitrate/nitrite transporter-like MFS transporter
VVQTNDPVQAAERVARIRVLTLSFTGFTLMFAVWTMFGVLGVPIREEFGLTNVQLSWLIAGAILNGAIWRLVAGILADRYGGKIVFTSMLFLTAIPAFLVAYATSFPMLLLYGFLVGFAGNAFSVGTAWNAAWFPRQQQGYAMGFFGAGNVGASVTKFIGPALIAAVPAAGFLGGAIPGDWRFLPFLYGVLLVVMGLAVWFLTPRVDRKPAAGRPISEMLAPLKELRVWRFSLYYVVTLGAYVALAGWLPRYFVDVFGLPLYQAALLTLFFILPSSLMRPVGGWLSDQFGARRVMYWTWGGMLLTSGILMMPEGHIVLYLPNEGGGMREVMHYTMTVWSFTLLIFLMGTAQGIGKAANIKYIPEYYPKDVGTVTGLVGMLGALGGFFLPPLFAYTEALTGLPQMTFAVVFVLAAICLIWMHLTVLAMLNKAAPELKGRFDPPPGSSP